MKKICITLWAAMAMYSGFAQTFITKGTIEFEVKSNLKKTYDNAPWMENFVDQLPQFMTSYYTYTFADNKSVYKLDRVDEKSKVPDFMKKEEEGNEWYADFNQGKMYNLKTVVGSPFNIEDSLNNIEWRLSNESRVIAGFNCRKATGRLFDSVYVFVFYTEEISISGGPCSVSGLPGMVLGMTIPRLYTSWIATKVSVVNVNESIIKPVAAKKTMPVKEMRKILIDKSKDWGGGDDENFKKFIQMFLWRSML